MGRHQDISLHQGDPALTARLVDEFTDGVALLHLPQILQGYDFQPPHNFPVRLAFSSASTTPISRSLSYLSPPLAADMKLSKSLGSSISSAILSFPKTLRGSPRSATSPR